MYAASIGHAQSVDFLLDYELDEKEEIENRALQLQRISITDMSGRNALHYACQTAKIDNIKLIMCKAGTLMTEKQFSIWINSTTRGGNTALQIASKVGDVDIVTEILNTNCNPFNVNRLRQTALDLTNEDCSQQIDIKVQ